MRFFDILFILATAPVWVPLATAVAIVSRIVQGSPVLFFDERAGKDGKPFRLVKFRTMRVGEGSDAARLTPLGAFLRKTSLDELPELWNVLKGEMALVGPRPLPVRYLPRYSAEQRRRHEVLPGLTGWAQVHGRNALDWDEKFRYDVYYVDNRSFCLDVKILLMTVAQVVSCSQISHAGEATMSEFRGQANGR